MREPLKVLDLFSGIGGFSLGLERTGGFKTVAFCEIEEFPRRVLDKHWPGVPIHRDVRELRAEHVGAVDVICGGFPCQDISTAGKGAGLSGERSGLWREYARLVGELRPSFVIVENVAALLGRGLGTVLGDLASSRYDAWWDCIRALDVGAPHLRDRLWITAYPGSEQYEGFGDALRRSIAAQLSQAAVAHAPQQSKREQADKADAIADCGQARHELGDRRQCVAHADSKRPEGRGLSEGGRVSGIDAERRSSDERGCRVRPGVWWTTEPDVGRVADGVPARVDRLRGLGNAVVPQIPEMIGRAILAAITDGAAVNSTKVRTQSLSPPPPEAPMKAQAPADDGLRTHLALQGRTRVMNANAKTLEELVARAHAIRDAGSDVLDLAGFWPLIEVAAANLPAPDYTAMTGPELLHACRDDAHKWATAFCQHAKKQGHDMDHGWMVGWFANAIEHSHDVRTGGGPVVMPDGSAFFVAKVK